MPEIGFSKFNTCPLVASIWTNIILELTFKGLSNHSVGTKLANMYLVCIDKTCYIDKAIDIKCFA